MSMYKYNIYLLNLIYKISMDSQDIAEKIADKT